MSNAVSLPPGAARKRGQNLTVERQQVIIGKLMDKMIEGYHSTSELARETGVSRPTVDRYRPLVDELIGKTRIDRNAIRALQIRRTYTMIETLMNDLKHAVGYKERAAYYSQIYKFSSHLALITGLNVETQVHVDAKKLVVIRSNNANKVENERDDVPDAEIIDQ